MNWHRSYDYKLDWFTSFVAVAEHHGFSPAARALFRSQPRVSVQMAELERALGMRLFDRSVQPVALTPEGRSLLPLAIALLDAVQDIEEFSAAAAGEIYGSVKVGMYPSAAAALFPQVVSRLSEAHPNLELVLWEGSTLSLEEGLVKGEVDLIVRPMLPAPDNNHLVHTLLWSEPIVAVVPEHHKLAEEASVNLEELAGTPLVMIGESFARGGSQFETDLAFAAAGLMPTAAFHTSQPQTLVAMARQGLGIGLTNALAMQTSNLDGVRLLDVAGTSYRREVALWWRQDGAQTRAIDAVRDVVVKVAEIVGIVFSATGSPGSTPPG
jgi:DNA-binding transcriptional LysR family regulator